jgi:hypothetical protein
MKRILSITIVAFSMLAVGSLNNTASAQPYEDDLSYQDFYDELDPYGTWMDYPEYGYVWRPNLGADFRPYSTNGHWVWSDEYEWIWVSNYSWGWAPFHYGRWFYDPFYGWMWVPGYEWSPAWVAWRHGGDYYGWAPIGPGIHISIGFSLGSYNPPIDYWCFAPRRYIVSPRLYDYCVPYTNNVTIINQTTIINNFNYNRNVFRTGPGRRDVERYAGRITPTRFRDVNSSGRAGFRNNEVSVYRPRIRENNDNRNIAPRRFERFEREGRNEGNARVTRRNGNNLPARRFEANERTSSARPENDNAINNRRNDRFERNSTDNRSERMNRPFERPRVNQAPQGNGNPGNRNNENPANSDRRIARPFERDNTERQNNNRVERPAPMERNNNRMERPRPTERNNNSIEQRGRVEQRNNNVIRPQQVPRQTNRERVSSQPRQFENRGGNENRGNNTFRQQRGNERGGDNGNRQPRRR